jgi:hypothetical protein
MRSLNLIRNEKPLRISEGLSNYVEDYYPKYVFKILLRDVCFKRRMAFSLI